MRKLIEPKLLIATHNQGKLEEVAKLFEGRDIELVSAKELSLPEPEETEDNFVGNARIKAHAGAKASGLPTLADDSGIEIDALNGAPGVYTADWAETGSGRDFVMAMTKSYHALLKTGAEKPWTCRFCCTLVLAWPDGSDEVFEGCVSGQFTWPMRGEQGHGYDPIFLPDGYDQTFGEMDRWHKNTISHRANAFRKLESVL